MTAEEIRAAVLKLWDDNGAPGYRAETTCGWLRPWAYRPSGRSRTGKAAGHGRHPAPSTTTSHSGKEGGRT